MPMQPPTQAPIPARNRNSSFQYPRRPQHRPDRLSTMPLRQFRARDRGPTILNYGQRIVHPRRSPVPLSNFGAPRPQEWPRPGPECRQTSRPGEEFRHRNLVCGIEHRGRAPPACERAPGKAQRRETLEIRLFERQGRGLARDRGAAPGRRSARAKPGNSAIGMRMSGLPSCAITRAVAEFDQAMHDRLRMDQHVDLRRTEAQIDDAPR